MAFYEKQKRKQVTSGYRSNTQLSPQAARGMLASEPYGTLSPSLVVNLAPQPSRDLLQRRQVAIKKNALPKFQIEQTPDAATIVSMASAMFCE
jgi:hypothetical protein